MPNKIETLKDERHPVDTLPDIYRWANEGGEAISSDDLVRLKWFGLFHRKTTPGFFMLRIRIPNGAATSEHLLAIAEIAERCGRGAVDVTTRQAIQLRWITIEDVPRSEEHTSELQSLMRISYAVFCLKKKKKKN